MGDPPEVVERAVHCEALLKEEACSRVVALSKRNPAECPGPVRHAADVPDLTRPAHTLLDQVPGLVELSAPGKHDAAGVPRIRLGQGVARAAPDLDCLLGERTRSVEVAQPQRRIAHHAERACQRHVVSQPTQYGQARVGVATDRLVVALHERKRRCPAESHRPRLFEPESSGEEPLQALAALGVGPSQLPVAPERGADPQTDVRLELFGRPGQRRTQIVALGVESLEPAPLLWSE